MTAFCCYGCRLAHLIWRPPGDDASPGAQAARSTRARLYLAVFFAMASMTFSVALYASACYPPPEGWSHALGPLAPVLQWLAVAFAAPAIALLGVPLVLDALSGRQRREGTAAVNALIAAGVAAAYGLSIVHLIVGEGEVYVETAAMLLILLTLGRYLDARARERANMAVKELLALDPEHVWRLDPGRPDAAPERVPLAAVAAGDRLRVNAGERIPVDGVALQGSAAADEAVLTGESVPREIAAGDAVRAGALLVEGRIDVRARAVLGDRLLDRIAHLTVEAREKRMPLERLSETLSFWFLPLSLLVAVAAGAAAARSGTAAGGVLRGLAVLLISCPCALGIATPLAAWVAIGRAARRGVLVRGSAVFESLVKARRVYFDKTGTLTASELRVAAIVTPPGTPEAALLTAASSLASLSSHPASRAIAALAAGKGLRPEPVAAYACLPGLGLRGEIAGRATLLGSRRLIERERPGALTALEASLAAVPQAGELSWILVVSEGEALGALGLEEALRPEAARVVDSLRRLGLAVEVLTGDTPERGQRLAGRLGVPVHAQLLPAEKAQRLAAARDRGEFAVMVGDGHNDAPVIASAEVGVALQGGAELARDMADVVLLEEHGEPLGGLVDLFALARRTVRRIRLNLAWAFGYNAAGMCLAAAGIVHPLVAAAAMIVSSLLVVAVSAAGEPRRAPHAARPASSQAARLSTEAAPC